jgi:hypothetical protein
MRVGSVAIFRGHWHFENGLTLVEFLPADEALGLIAAVCHFAAVSAVQAPVHGGRSGGSGT